MESMHIRTGAEAEIHLDEWEGRRIVKKIRVPKKYRNPDLDERLRSHRIKIEARLMAECRKVGISVPIIYDIDLGKNTIIMEYVEGDRVKDILNSGQSAKKELCWKIGENVGRMHRNGIAHGDLTTSNMIARDGRLYFIDFSLGEKTKEIEVLGVDLHLLREAFLSAHSQIFNLFNEVLRGYLTSNPEGKKIIQKMNDIERRGRYT